VKKKTVGRPRELIVWQISNSFSRVFLHKGSFPHPRRLLTRLLTKRNSFSVSFVAHSRQIPSGFMPHPRSVQVIAVSYHGDEGVDHKQLSCWHIGRSGEITPPLVKVFTKAVGAAFAQKGRVVVASASWPNTATKPWEKARLFTIRYIPRRPPVLP